MPERPQKETIPFAARRRDHPCRGSQSAAVNVARRRSAALPGVHKRRSGRRRMPVRRAIRPRRVAVGHRVPVTVHDLPLAVLMAVDVRDREVAARAGGDHLDLVRGAVGDPSGQQPERLADLGPAGTGTPTRRTGSPGRWPTTVGRQRHFSKSATFSGRKSLMSGKERSTSGSGSVRCGGEARFRLHVTPLTSTKTTRSKSSSVSNVATWQGPIVPTRIAGPCRRAGCSAVCSVR